MSKKRGLGKGIGALIPTAGEAMLDTGGPVGQVAIDTIITNPSQPRKKFSEETIIELAASIREQGILQPLLVKRDGTGYELIAGERRLRAALKAGLSTVPVIVKDVDDRARQEIALIENIQREDLNVLEEAEAYQGLIERFSYTQEEVSKRVGKSRTVVTNSLRLLKLSSTIKADLLDDKVSMGHARAYLGLDDPLLQQEVHRTVIKKGLSVRQTEDCVKRHRSGSFKTKSTKKQQNTSEYDHVVEELRKRFATKIDISRSGKRGKIVIEFFSGDDFERIYDLLRG